MFPKSLTFRGVLPKVHTIEYPQGTTQSASPQKDFEAVYRKAFMAMPEPQIRPTAKDTITLSKDQNTCTIKFDDSALGNFYKDMESLLADALRTASANVTKSRQLSAQDKEILNWKLDKIDQDYLLKQLAKLTLHQTLVPDATLRKGFLIANTAIPRGTTPSPGPNNGIYKLTLPHDSGEQRPFKIVALKSPKGKYAILAINTDWILSITRTPENSGQMTIEIRPAEESDTKEVFQAELEGYPGLFERNARERINNGL